MMGAQSVEINYTKILLVEGKDDVNFFQFLIEKLKLPKNIQIFEIGGKDEFPNKIKTFVLSSNFRIVDSLAYIRDTDNELSAAFDSVKYHIQQAGLTPPEVLCSFSSAKVRVGIYFLPNNRDNGTLEDLCLSITSFPEQFECIDPFFKCLSNKIIKPKTNHISKSKVLLYLASMEEVVNTIGLGAKKKYWNFNSKNLKSLNAFLKLLST